LNTSFPGYLRYARVLQIIVSIRRKETILIISMGIKNPEALIKINPK
jgi:hypothetical protein